MDIKALRREHKIRLADVAAEAGLSSVGFIHDMQKGRRPWSVKAALALETLSNGAIPARAINEDVRLVEDHVAAKSTKPTT